MLATALALGTLALGAMSATAAGPTVSTTGGSVEGLTGPSGDEWRGIPYAAPPIGSLRWRAPAPATPWPGVRDATSFGEQCIQPDFPDGTRGSEDCLYLNVSTPAGTAASSGLPVMVHLHPGGNFFGQAYQDASAFTDRGVIVVTLNYRLGVLGFMGLPALTADGHSGEYGVLDQLAALHWVQDNIAAFGGDPARVTLFGSSAGSFDAVAIMASPLSQGLLARVAVQGIAFWPLIGANETGNAEEFGSDVAGAVGCGSSADVLGCLRALPADELVAAVGGGDIGGPPVGSSVLPRSPLELLGEGSVPLLVGFDREEDAAFTDIFRDPYGSREWTHDANELVGPRQAGRARALYPFAAYDSPLWSYVTMLTDAVHGCPTRRLANTVAAHAPVWRYLYTHTYEEDPFFSQFRAAHILEDPLLWQTDLGFGHVPTAAEERLSGRMTDYWTNFAKTGNPNGPSLPTWPAYATPSEPVLTLDDEIGTTSGYHRAQCALMDGLSGLFPAPWETAIGLRGEPPGFANGHARGF